MKRNEINKLFTEKVMEYLAKGYIIFTNTMSGSQGEYAKVDLIKGKDIIRIYLDSYSDSRAGVWYGIQLVVGKVNSKNLSKIDLESGHSIIWSSELEIVERYCFDNVSDNSNPWYISIDNKQEMDKIRQKHKQRNNLKFSNRIESIKLPEKARNIVLNYVRNQPKCKTVKIQDIEVLKEIRQGDTPRYRIHVLSRGRWFTLM